MSSMKNRVQLIGNLGRDPEVKNFEKGVVRASFTVATNESYKNSDGETVEHVEWHQVIAWKHTAQFAEKHLSKGTKVVIDGKISNRSFESKNGERKYVTEIIAQDIVILSQKKETAEAA